ncbi:MAG TPA: sigma 54-interacting transcriptional regulator [Candidatus Binatia bacterium]|jgi:two-component system response regulator PilR (NtrC family)|nr:sigma 54-interacting transcriptional regulator [Candidatus Binatia bacterium]
MLEAGNDLHRRLLWFLLLRVGITTCLLGTTVWLYYYRLTGTDTSSGRVVLYTIAVIYFISLASGLLLSEVRNLTLFSYAQVVFDTLFVTGIVLLTGGLDSPFSFFYHLSILNAAFLLHRHGALVAASLAALGYGGTIDLLYYGVLPAAGFMPPLFLTVSTAPNLQLTVRLVVNLSSFYLIAFLGSYLTQRLSQAETLLAERDLALGRLSSLYQGVIKTLDKGILVADANGIIEYANGSIAEIIGSAPIALTGRQVNDLLPTLDPNQPHYTPFEFIFQKEGSSSERILRTTLSPLNDTYGNRFGALYSVQDVTSVKEMERGLREAEELERATVVEELVELDSFAGLSGRSEAMRKVYRFITKVAECTTTVLITGESGTGKELVARAIHEKGPRASRLFVPVNCGAIPANLMESELFGHVRGAFTDAVSDRTGLFRQADGGTLFLDEVGELPLMLQAKLLRVLQDHEVVPVGGNKGTRVDVRVLAATNKDLEKEVAAGRFREDLFYRLNVIRIALPPLRERDGDLPLLLRQLIYGFAAANGKTIDKISPLAMRALLDYPYPGNIRELENVIQLAVTMAEGETIQLADLPARLQGPPQAFSDVPFAENQQNPSTDPDFFSKGVSLDTELEEYEQNILRAALEKSGGVQKRAAEFLGINYRSLRHRLQKYNLP